MRIRKVVDQVKDWETIFLFKAPVTWGIIAQVPFFLKLKQLLCILDAYM